MQALEEIDLGTLFFFQHHRLKGLNGYMVSWTHLGDNPVLLLLAALFALVFVAAGRCRAGALLVTVALSAWGLSEGVKTLVKRPRPAPGVEVLVPIPSSFSFPSGHAMCSMTIYATAALLAARGLRRRTATVVILVGVGLGMLVGVTRMYLGVHYLSDVVAGWCGGVGLALLARWVDGIRAPAAAPVSVGERDGP